MLQGHFLLETGRGERRDCVQKDWEQKVRFGLSVLTLGLAGILAGCSPANTAKESATQNETNTQNMATDGANKPAKSIAITAIVEHPSLDDIRYGVIDELASQGYVPDQNLTVNFQSAQGNTATAAQISKQFVADNPDLIVTISTPSAQSMVAATKEIPIVYTAISDPLRAKLLDEAGKPTQANVTGLSSQLPLDPQLDLIQEIMPNAKAIGFVYSPGEANSVSVRDALKEALPKRGLTLVDVPANRSTDVAMATRSLDGKADLIFTSLDNNVASAFEAMTAAANELKLPIIASDEFSVRRGATAALGVNDYDFGRTTGKMAAKVLDGTPINSIEPQIMNNLTLYVSPKHAQTQGISLPQAVLEKGINVDETPAKKSAGEKNKS